MQFKLIHLWHILRRLSGDDAYERYLTHHAEFHASMVDAPPPLSRKAFVKLWQDNKWSGINRCC
ncbi:MAG: YbdD/YjiX family protein [Betaproteobacteria bacterium]|jgi:uncharacterized short protein YbdD (DUF466 family)|nr:YbdD/YjiX family protein [Betaproteobacteria bacterium]MCH9849080.1 YbdD/YjiX family protein [Betaproteobacteria bacterium]